ncbi:hypothetical protein HPB49_013039 [Dermacentor silvarum]|uniref:Uncharacterized protein n=1 Tax=Dermacentor silvarum TaxID=543639 RepID=A0ACB8D543_DERSI|nr:hypothetical protein HPB49_013039 [Dermacentor silvarum]
MPVTALVYGTSSGKNVCWGLAVEVASPDFTLLPGVPLSACRTKELTAWMTSLRLDLNNLTSSDKLDPVDMVLRLSLDFGIPVLLVFSFHDVSLVNNKRLLNLGLNQADYTWFKYRRKVLKKSKKKLGEYYVKMLQKYGVHSSRLRRLSSKINKYETEQMWAGPIAKYTKNMYRGNDTIAYRKDVPVFLAKALESKKVGSRGIMCYIAWNLFRQLVKYTDPDKLVKKKNPEDVCYSHASRLMGYAITSPFVHSVVSKKTLMEANEMASNIRKAFHAAFQSSRWMTGSVRETALLKITNMRHHIGAVGALLDGAYVEKYYASFPDLPTDQFFKAWREAAAAAIHQASADTTMVLHAESSANGYYLAKYNTMVLPEALLLPKIFFTEGPSAFNYGSFGTVLRSRQGVLNDTVDSENIADLGGTPMAYSAFTSLSPSKRDTTLPDIALSANQLFFIGHCTPWCETQTTASPPWLSGKFRYPPGRSRCIVPLMNMPEFSDAFHCKQGSYMNPPNKCGFWT